MTWRAVVLGAVLGLAVAGLSYFNDQVIYQTYLIGNHLPIAVFGVAVALVLLVNPVLSWLGPRWPLRTGEIAIVIALGLAVCGWPASNLLRYFTGVMALPPLRLEHQPAWQSAEVMSYLPGHPTSPLHGSGLLLNDGVYVPEVVDPLLTGSDARVYPQDVPWRAWWPTLRLWIGSALLVGLMSLCLALIVHPQWAHRERLMYPVVRFVEEVARREPGSAMPTIARQRTFWIGFGIVLVWHLLLGLNKWFPEVPALARQFDFRPLLQLFPTVRRVPDVNFLFHPVLYPSVIGFAYFIRARVGFSVGFGLVAWVAFWAVLLQYGVLPRDDRFTVGANGTALRLGAWLAATVAILYYGRRYYLRLAGAAVGLSREPDTPAYAVWAARGLGLGCGLFLAIMVRYAGLTVLTASLLLAMLLMIFLVLTRINVETGLFHAQPDFLPSAMIGGLLGVEALGPSAFLVLTLASLVLVADPREAVMPYLANALRLGDQVAEARPTRTAGPLLAMLVLGLVVATVATLTLQYNQGLNLRDSWSNQYLPRASFAEASRHILEMRAVGLLDTAPGTTSLQQLARMDPDAGVVGWGALGFVFFAVCAVARLRLSRWPVHPILFLVWGTWPASNLAVSFLIGAGLKRAAVHYTGERGYRRFLPVMVGFIAAELLAALAWNLVGWGYFLETGVQPSVYRILP